MVIAGQSPNTKRMPASANERKALARSLAAMNSRTPMAVRMANTAIPICRPKPQRRIRELTPRRRSVEAAKAMASRTMIPRTPLKPAPAAVRRSRVELERRVMEARAQAVHRAKHRRLCDQASLEAGLSWKVDEGQADERGDQPLPRHARQRHDHAQRKQDDPGQVLED